MGFKAGGVSFANGIGGVSFALNSKAVSPFKMIRIFVDSPFCYSFVVLVHTRSEIRTKTYFVSSLQVRVALLRLARVQPGA